MKPQTKPPIYLCAIENAENVMERATITTTITIVIIILLIPFNFVSCKRETLCQERQVQSSWSICACQNKKFAFFLLL